jgi:hypothetical protein
MSHQFSGNQHASNKPVSVCYVLRAGIFCDLFLVPEVGGDTFFRNVTMRRYSPEVKTLHEYITVTVKGKIVSILN